MLPQRPSKSQMKKTDPGKGGKTDTQGSLEAHAEKL